MWARSVTRLRMDSSIWLALLSGVVATTAPFYCYRSVDDDKKSFFVSNAWLLNLYFSPVLGHAGP